MRRTAAFCAPGAATLACVTGFWLTGAWGWMVPLVAAWAVTAVMATVRLERRQRRQRETLSDGEWAAWVTSHGLNRDRSQP
jgi:hypothetical protein